MSSPCNRVFIAAVSDININLSLLFLFSLDVVNIEYLCTYSANLTLKIMNTIEVSSRIN